MNTHQCRCSLGVVCLAVALCCASVQTGCEPGGGGSGQNDCAYDRVLTAGDAPCLCGESLIDATALTGECACRSSGFECFDTSDCEVTEIADASELWEAVPDFGGWWGLYSTGPRPITVDLVATTDLVVDASDFCAIGAGCEPIRFMRGVAVNGVTIEGPDDYYGYDTFYRFLHVAAGTRFRLRPYNRDIHPIPPNFAPVIELVEPCSRQCAAGEARCGADEVCYEAGSDYCYGCTDRGAAVCACQNADGPEPDTTPCEYWISGDQFTSGECYQGVCEPPTW